MEAEREIHTCMCQPASERASVCVFPICIPSLSEIIKKRHIRESERERMLRRSTHSHVGGIYICVCMEYCIKIEQPKTSLFPTPPEPPQAKAASLLPIQNFIFNSAFPFSFFPFPTRIRRRRRRRDIAAAAHAPKAAVSLQLFLELGRGLFIFFPLDPHTHILTRSEKAGSDAPISAGGQCNFCCTAAFQVKGHQLTRPHATIQSTRPAWDVSEKKAPRDATSTKNR